MSHLTLQGNLQALLCNECLLPLAGSRILVYGAETTGAETTAAEAAAAKTSFRELSTGEVENRANRPLGEATVGDDGSFRAVLEGGERGALEIVARLDRLPEAGAELAEPVHLHLATVEPEWQQSETGLAAQWQYLIPSRYWCALLARWGWWVICGRVVEEGTKDPIAGLTVTAFDRDWLQDDTLGQATTDGQGRFHIWYRTSDFTPTIFSPLLNLEMTAGPDVYFDVETAGGNKLIDESPSTGRLPGRENVGHCFCVELVVPVGEGEGQGDSPIFTRVGNFNILTDFNSDGTANTSKLGAGGAGWGFHGSPELHGLCPETHPVDGQPMHYRFLYVDPVTSGEKPMTPDMVVATIIGSRKLEWDLDANMVLETVYQDIILAGSGATTPPLASGGSGPLPPHVIVPDADGWIAVPQDSVGNGPQLLLRFNSGKIVPGGSSPGSGAGNTPADPKSGATTTLIFETSTDPSDASKTERQTQTVNVRFNNWSEVRELDLVEFINGSAGACTGLTTEVTPKYTVDHEFVAEWSMSMSSAASPWSPPALPSGNSSEAATLSPAIAVGGWPPCSYVLSLSSRRALTDGKHNDDSNPTLLTFCKR